jgi:hypothetical protein
MHWMGFYFEIAAAAERATVHSVFCMHEWDEVSCCFETHRERTNEKEKHSIPDKVIASNFYFLLSMCSIMKKQMIQFLK